jgi:hypothetical protein
MSKFRKTNGVWCWDKYYAWAWEQWKDLKSDITLKDAITLDDAASNVLSDKISDETFSQIVKKILGDETTKIV